jgi:hypothetical protein
MSVRSFHSVFMASAVAGAALGCYLISLRVASERAALEQVESRIVLAQRDIRLLQTEIGTRARLAQLERWNVRALSLSAPTADQILGDKFQLARLIAPERRPAVEAPVILASAPAPTPQQPLASGPQGTDAPRPVDELLHEASVTVPPRNVPEAKASTVAKSVPLKSTETKPVERKAAASKAAEPRPPLPKAVASKPSADGKKAGDKKAKAEPSTLTTPVRTAKADPLAPIPAEQPKAEASRTDR